MYGFIGSILRINLSTMETRVEPLPKVVIQNFMGGNGLGAYLLIRETKPGFSPLGPENKVMLVTGPLQGTRVPITGRYAVITKSPLTHFFLATHAGGSIGPELKFSGYDAVILDGSSEDPCYITIGEDNVEFKDGKKLVGLSALEKERKIQRIAGEKTKVMAIGKAGEKKVKYACVTAEGFRNLGRGGVGAIFGSKGLLAIGINGPRKEIPVADPEKVKELATDLRARVKAGREAKLPIYRVGTTNLVQVASKRDQLPIKNFTEGMLEDTSGIDHEAATKYPTKKKPCFRCPLSCAHIYQYEFPFGEADHIIGVPEYETLGMIGANCNLDIDTTIEINYWANAYGLDTISLGNVLGWFMECSERGFVPDQYTNESLFYGDARGAIELIKKIVKRSGVGDILADGVQSAASAFGSPTEQFAVHVKGLEMAAWDPRGRYGLGLSYATAPMGASHLQGWPRTTKPPKQAGPITPEIVQTLHEEQDLKIVKDNLVICHFTHSIVPGLTLADGQALFTAVTGCETDVRDIAQNTWAVSRFFNMREFGPPVGKYDRLPYRLLEEPLPTGRAAGSRAFESLDDFNNGLQYLYKRRRCTQQGDLTQPEIDRVTDLLG
ncbi:MAG: aldehyde ferredoxin oxidoreductase family protein [Candidatus Heimdallarchaeota archaeon]